MKRSINLLLIIALLISTWIALNVGTVHLSHVWKLLWGSGDSQSIQILREIRGPRVLAAIFVGGGLGIAGALTQSATQNSLAEPGILGASGGAAFFTLVAILFNLTTIGSVGSIFVATIGALTFTAITFLLARKSTNGFAIVIIGIAVSSILTGLVGITALMINRPDAKGVTFWTLGSLSLVTKGAAVLVSICILFVSLPALFVSGKLDYLALGDRRSRHLGVNPNSIRWFTFLLMAVIIGVITSNFGSITFLALAVPHIARSINGARGRAVIPTSAVVGALLLLISDTVSRTLIAPNELPIGLVTALIGAPVLLIGVYRGLAVRNG